MYLICCFWEMWYRGAVASRDISRSDSRVNEISAGLSVGEESIKQAAASKCFM